MVRILFVCLGNICRSPMAEAIFLQLVKKANLVDQFEIDSAGTGHWHVGEKAHRGTLAVLNTHEVPYTGRARQITRADLGKWDYIITMDEDNMEAVRLLGSSSARIVSMMSFAPERGFSEVPDPYYDGRYELVYDLLNSACTGLLSTLLKDRRDLFVEVASSQPIPAT
ncbi:MAG: low molecular weight protein-tyrosine-phosphatase [Chthonomonadales bacterium]